MKFGVQMTLPTELIANLQNQFPGVCEDLQQLQLKFVAVGQPMPTDSLMREHLLHGAGRRLSVIRRSLQNIFRIFPPNTERPLGEESVADVQINLHAFVMNLYGLFDNLGWAFVLRHNLYADVGGKKGIGLFAKSTQAYLPEPIKSYITSKVMVEWHDKYAKSFRDALAHRIPPYLPPAQFTPEEGVLYNELEDEKIRCIRAHEWERLDKVWAEQASIGKPCFTFLHAFTEEAPPRPTLLHPQLICDGLALVEFGKLFLQHWGHVEQTSK